MGTGYSGASSIYTTVAANLDALAHVRRLSPAISELGRWLPDPRRCPLINSLAPVTSAINAMNDNGGSGTVGSIGVAWAYRLLSPNGPSRRRRRRDGQWLEHAEMEEGRGADDRRRQ